MLAIELQIRLKELQAERLMATDEGIAVGSAYMAHLDDEIADTSRAYIQAAVTEIATLRAGEKGLHGAVEAGLLLLPAAE
jgi:hypothetical protein